MNRFLIACLTRALVASSLLLAIAPAEACTRCLKVFADGTVVVGRSMDWVEDPGSELWIFPRGMKRQGNAGPGSFAWTTTYGSVGVSFYGVASVDGAALGAWLSEAAALPGWCVCACVCVRSGAG